MMKYLNHIRGLQHLGIPTTKLQESIAFYEQIGFQIINEEKQLNGDNVVFVEANQLVIELWEVQFKSEKNGAIDHIALDVTDIEVLYQEAIDNDLIIVSKGIETLHYWKKGIKFFIIEGPNQEKIEFCQINL
ncbi:MULTISPECIES: VOC family protein [unclassified Enterococcus]|uniref:VOC family protein n=1 Tax=unclassified Enterococcus TaxID=2608891 RepID=UPI001555BC47|nr:MULTISPECIES: VOC family protein [unclassified Enterococcus]MBS7577822.1 VOC family protein [Enterococcus sp. MMGLQ5-2]MBS7585082.1 VOC family protein [Enterococcus sp. MMGLQ5-1]NPD12938.1 VOC family protein [Enterococcus sp. MMGLQ5-1]NPD37652.1 VOC family protein [Enterococcus sp. MMGLQ5-2]